MSNPPLRSLQLSKAFQAAGSFTSEFALAPGPGPEPQAAPHKVIRLGSLAILQWPAIARDEGTWRWSRPPRPAHQNRTPDRGACASSATP